MRNKKVMWVVAVLFLLPIATKAQGVGDNIESLQSVLDNLYTEMLPMCKDLISVGRSIAGFAALFYIASRVWKNIANAEPIDFYPLFRPFCLGFCIVNFMSVVSVINGVLQPTVTGTRQLVTGSDEAIKVLLAMKEAAIKETDPYKMYVGVNGVGDKDKWYRYTHDDQDPQSQHWWDAIGNDVKFAAAKASYNFRNSIKEWMSEVLHVLFEAAALCINTIRTFQLIVLAILGPLVFGISVFDGFAHTLSAWLAKYINIFLWLPVANVFGAIIGKIQENLLKIDLSQIKDTGDTFFSPADTGYLVFMIIGIIGYFTVPSMSNFIVNAGGGSMASKVTSTVVSGASMAGGVAGAAAARASQGVSNIADMKQHYQQGRDGSAAGSGVSGAIGRTMGHFLASRLSGDSGKSSPSGGDQAS